MDIKGILFKIYPKTMSLIQLMRLERGNKNILGKLNHEIHGHITVDLVTVPQRDG